MRLKKDEIEYKHVFRWKGRLVIEAEGHGETFREFFDVYGDKVELERRDSLVKRRIYTGDILVGDWTLEQVFDELEVLAQEWLEEVYHV
jgi:hypothetical protein